MIIPLYKPYGKSSHQLAHEFGKRVGEKASHTGTLDPAAEGVLVVTTGPDRLIKQEIAKGRKVYRVSVITGISTDTHDLVGIPTDLILGEEISSAKIEDACKKLTGTYQQTLPAFSAKRIQGKSSFDLAKEGVEFKASDTVTIYTITLLSSIKVKKSSLQKYHDTAIGKIKGDFRQSIILSKWKHLWEKVTKNKVHSFQSFELEITCAKRTYIRALIRDLSQLLRTPLVVSSLVRTKNGEYSITDCICLI